MKNEETAREIVNNLFPEDGRATNMAIIPIVSEILNRAYPDPDPDPRLEQVRGFIQKVRNRLDDCYDVDEESGTGKLTEYPYAGAGEDMALLDNALAALAPKEKP